MAPWTSSSFLESTPSSIKLLCLCHFYQHAVDLLDIPENVLLIAGSCILIQINVWVAFVFVFLKNGNKLQ